MKIRRLQLLPSFVVLASACALVHADWKVHPATEFSKEERVWASAKEKGLDFSWSGSLNARHEAEGYGVLEWFKQDESRRETSLVYTGEMKSGRRHGTGVALHLSGSKYSGQWSDNFKEGKGEYWYSNGDYYAGSFRNDLMHGPGRYVSADGMVFEGTFVADERDGPGTVIYPDGRRYSSTWSAGRDVNPSGAPTSAKPYLMLGVDVRRYALNGDILSQGEGRVDEQYLTYRGRLTDGNFVIEPDWPYWVAWSKGGPVSGDASLVVGVFPVFLDIRVFNKSKEQLAIRRAEAVVEESVPDLEPILQLRDPSISGGVTCEIVNFAVNRVDNCEVAFNILPPNTEPKFESYQFIENVEPFSERATFSLAPAMNALGMDAKAIAAIETSSDDDGSRGAIMQRAEGGLGPFSKFAEASGDYRSAFGLIAGEVRIAWTDHLGSKRTKRVKFQFRKCFYLFGAEMAVEGAPSGNYDLFLKIEGSDYVVPFTYKRTIAPGANDRFTLQVASEVSTYQQFRIRLTTADGREIVSPLCRMHFLVPRKFSWKEGYVIEEP
jgi:hypothetical protein